MNLLFINCKYILLVFFSSLILFKKERKGIKRNSLGLRSVWGKEKPLRDLRVL